MRIIINKLPLVNRPADFVYSSVGRPADMARPADQRGDRPADQSVRRRVKHVKAQTYAGQTYSTPAAVVVMTPQSAGNLTVVQDIGVAFCTSCPSVRPHVARVERPM